MGVYVTSLVKGSPAYDADIPVGSYLLSMTSATNHMDLQIPTDFTEFMTSTVPGEEITVTYLTSSGEHTVTMELGENGTKGYFGVSTTLSGMSITTPAILLESGINPFYGKETISEYAMGIISFIGAPFKGFSPVPESCTWWYECTFMDTGTFWTLIYVIYWTFWLNLVLGVSNALPAIPFDGGYLFRDGMDWLLEKIGVSDIPKRENLVNVFTNFTSYLMLFSMLLVLVVIVI